MRSGLASYVAAVTYVVALMLVGCHDPYVPPRELTPISGATVSGVAELDGLWVKGSLFKPYPSVLVMPGVHRLGFVIHHQPVIPIGPEEPSLRFSVRLSGGIVYEFKNDTGIFGAGRIRICNKTTDRVTFINDDSLIFYDQAGNPLSDNGPLEP